MLVNIKYGIEGETRPVVYSTRSSGFVFQSLDEPEKFYFLYGGEGEGAADIQKGGEAEERLGGEKLFLFSGIHTESALLDLLSSNDPSLFENTLTLLDPTEEGEAALKRIFERDESVIDLLEEEFLDYRPVPTTFEEEINTPSMGDLSQVDLERLIEEGEDGEDGDPTELPAEELPSEAEGEFMGADDLTLLASQQHSLLASLARLEEISLAHAARKEEGKELDREELERCREEVERIMEELRGSEMVRAMEEEDAEGVESVQEEEAIATPEEPASKAKAEDEDEDSTPLGGKGFKSLKDSVSFLKTMNSSPRPGSDRTSSSLRQKSVPRRETAPAPGRTSSPKPGRSTQESQRSVQDGRTRSIQDGQRTASEERERREDSDEGMKAVEKLLDRELERLEEKNRGMFRP